MPLYWVAYTEAGLLNWPLLNHPIKDLIPGEKSMRKTIQPQHHIALTLTNNKTADFYYSDLAMAETHYNQLGATMNLGGQAIKTIKLIRAANPHLVA